MGLLAAHYLMTLPHVQIISRALAVHNLLYLPQNKYRENPLQILHFCCRLFIYSFRLACLPAITSYRSSVSNSRYYRKKEPFLHPVAEAGKNSTIWGDATQKRSTDTPIKISRCVSVSMRLCIPSHIYRYTTL
jgi:hypothetical protein